MFRTSARTVRASARRFALFGEFKADPAKAKAYADEIAAARHHAVGTTALWKKISLFVAAPVTALVAVNTLFVELEHAKHREHLAHVSDDEWPVQYQYQNIRLKDFFWGDGDKTLFWNPSVNRHVVSE